MAQITFPPGVPVTSFNFALDVRRNVHLVNVQGFPSVLKRTPGLWRGTFIILQMDSDVGPAFEAWLNAMSDPDNFSEVRINRKTVPVAAGVTVVSGPTLRGGLIHYTLSAVIPDLSPGCFVRIDDRLFQVVVVANPATQIALSPAVRNLSAGDVVSIASTMRVMRDPEQVGGPHPRNADFYGPYVFPFVEKQ